VPQTKTITDTNATELHPSVLPSTQYQTTPRSYASISPIALHIGKSVASSKEKHTDAV